MIDSAYDWRFLLYALLVAAAASDLRSMRIPNALPIAVVAALVGALLLAGAPPDAFRDAALSGLIGLFVGYALFRLRLMGGGDGKLFAASAAWFGSGALLAVGFFVSLAGIVVALLALVARSSALAKQPASVRAALKTPVPYGVAIALGVVIAAEFSALIR